MQVFTAKTVELERCQFCGGIWLDRGELEAVTRKALQVERFEGHTTRRCAFCGITMATALVGSVPAEVCAACMGTYLDDGELEELAERKVPLERVGAPAPAANAISYRCVGCGDALTHDMALTTSRGMSCRNCYGASDFGGPSSTYAQSGYGNRALLEDRIGYGNRASLEDRVDATADLIDAAIRFFMS